jgi:hypothetical protein
VKLDINDDSESENDEHVSPRRIVSAFTLAIPLSISGNIIQIYDNRLFVNVFSTKEHKISKCQISA